MRKNQKRWIALAGATTLSVAGLVAAGAPATAEHRPGDDPLAWPVVQQSAATYTLDGFEIAYLPPGLDRHGVHADSTTGRAGERVSTISWVQGPDSVYGKVAVIRSKDITDLEDLREARYGRLDDDALEKTEHDGAPAYLSKETGELFWVPESGVGVEAYLQPDRWESEELVSLAEGVRRIPQGADSEEGQESGAAEQGEQSGQEADAGEQTEEAGQAEAGEQAEEAEEAAGQESEEAHEGAGDAAEETAGGAQESADGASEDAAGQGPAEEEAGATGEAGAEAPGGEGSEQEEASEASEGAQTRPAGSEGEASEGRQETGAPASDPPQEEDGSQQSGEQEGAQPAPDSGAEAADDTGAGQPAEDTGSEQPAEEAGSGTEAGEAPGAEAPGVQEGAESGDAAEGEFVPGVATTDVRTCLAEELLAEDAQVRPAEVAADDAALLELWRSVGTDARDEAVQTCGERFEAAPELVERMMADLAAEAGAAEDAGAVEAAEGAEQPEAGESAEDAADPESAEDETETADPAGLWDSIPWSLPGMSARL